MKFILSFFVLTTISLFGQTVGGNGVPGSSPGTSGAPTVVAGSGAGTSPTLAVVSGSNDLSGYVTATTGTTPTASAAVFTLSFNVVYTLAPKCLAWPANPATQALVGAAAAQIFPANISTSVFVLTQGATALAAATAYEWGYRCTQ
jgi:hypothetical protein